MQRIRKLEQTAMIVPDIHGDGVLFEAVLKEYKALQAAGIIKTLVFLGDLIHSYGRQDDSLEIVTRLMELESQGEDIVVLLGNHELAHVMAWELKKGNQEFTPAFEQAIKGKRREIISWMSALPFAIELADNMFLCHTGPNRAFGGMKDERWDFLMSLISPRDWYENFSFEKEFPGWENTLKEFSSESGAKWYQHPKGMLLFEIFMNGNELSQRVGFDVVTGQFLSLMTGSSESILISAHIGEKKGYKVLSPRHFRLGVSPEDRSRHFPCLILDRFPVSSALDLESKIKFIEY